MIPMVVVVSSVLSWIFGMTLRLAGTVPSLGFYFVLALFIRAPPLSSL